MFKTLRWDSIRRDIQQYVLTCPVCARTKAQHIAPSGLLQPLPIPPTPWHTLSLDFITDLPESNKHTAILVVVDMLSKMAHFIPLKGIPSATELSHIFLEHIVRLHGLPTKLVSDRASQFTSKFWKAFCSALGVEVALSSAYHPQTDGQTERVNQSLEQTLRSLISTLTSSWDLALPLAEFSYNNNTHTSIGCSPFYYLTGLHPRMLPILLPQTPTLMPSVSERLLALQDIQNKARQSLVKTKQDMKKQVDRHRTPEPSYQVGDLVWLSTRNITLEGPRKLQPRFIGPFPINKVLTPVTVRLQLPPEYAIHPVFHVSLVKPYHPNTRKDSPPPPILVGDHHEYEVQRILDAKRIRGRLFYLVDWKGYDPSERSWEPASYVHAPHLLTRFYILNPNKPRPVGRPLGGEMLGTLRTCALTRVPTPVS